MCFSAYIPLCVLRNIWEHTMQPYKDLEFVNMALAFKSLPTPGLRRYFSAQQNASRLYGIMTDLTRQIVQSI